MDSADAPDSPVLSPKDLIGYFARKTELARQLERKWRRMDKMAPANILQAAPETDMLLAEMESIDREFIERYGDGFKAELERLSGDPDTSSGRARVKLRAALNAAATRLQRVSSRIRDMKDDLGRELSELKSRRSRNLRRGRAFDQNG